MKQNWRKIIPLGIYIGVLIAISILIGSLTIYALIEPKALDDSKLVSFLSLSLALLSTVGLIVQTLGMSKNINKSEYISTQVCPRCNHKVDIRLKEAD